MQRYQQYIGAALGLAVIALIGFVIWSGGIEDATRVASNAIAREEEERRPFEELDKPSAPPPQIVAEVAEIVAAPPAEVGTVNGIVYGSAQQVQPNAEIRLIRMAWAEGIQRRHPPGANQTTLTDAHGVFSITGLPWGRYSVEATTDTGKGSATVDVRLGSPVAHVTVYLRGKGAIAGRVVSATGLPLGGVELLGYAHDGYRLDGMLWEAPMATTGPGGDFHIESLEGMSWRFLVRKEGYGGVITDPLPINGPLQTITLSEGIRFEGRVIESDTGAPVSGFPLVVDLVHYTESDAQGHYAVSIADWSDNTSPMAPIHGVDETYVFKTPIVVSDRDMVDGIVRKDIEVVKAVSLSGRVYDAQTGEGLVGCRVQANSKSNGFTATTGPGGHYAIEGLGAGAIEVKVAQPPRGYSYTVAARNPRSVQTNPGMVMEQVDFALEKGAQVAGIVVDLAGNPVPAARVQGQFMAGPNGIGGEYEESDTTDRQGAFVLATTGEASTLYLTAWSDTATVMNAGPTAVPPEGIAGIRLQLKDPMDGTVSGQVVDNEGRPVPVQLSIHPALPGDMPVMKWEGVEQQTGSDGTFAFHGLPRALYYLWGHNESVNKSVFVQAYDVDLLTTPTVTGLRLKAAVQRYINGTVTDAAGNPQAGVTLHVEVTARDGNVYHPQAFTDRLGHYSFSMSGDPIPCTVYLGDWREPIAVAPNVVPGEQEVNFVLPR